MYAADVGSAAAGADDARAVWVAPREALARWQRGEWLIPPWTREVLAPLAGRAGDALARLAEHGAEHAPLARLHELVPGVSVMPLRTPTLPPATHTNCYVVGTRGFAVIDPASPYPDEQAALADALAARVARGDRPIAVLLTHHHDDHIGGAAAVAGHLGVGVWAHERTADRVRGRLDIARTLADGDVVALIAGDDLVEPGASTAEGEPRRLRAVFTPGHAPGHLCFLDERSRFLVAGDMVAGVGTIVVEPSDGDMRAYLASLARMKALAPSAIGPAHGPAIGDPEALLDHYVAHRLWREARVLAALKAHGPARPDALVRHAYADVPVAIHPLAERSLIAHLIKLDGDGLAAVDGDVWRVI